MRKKILFVLLLITLGITGAWAEELSEKEAQQLAQSFANSHFGRKGGGSELKSLGQVSGLYVFNMSDKGGFVIVSNESRTIPILGYSDSGTFDPDNMPENMRAWLQGYADEIAWLQKQGSDKSEPSAKSRTRAGMHSTNAIEPLVTTKWDQGTPYNNLCPDYSPGSKSATGCAATAMAQVMYYHKWPETTAAIPGYTINGVTRSSLSATTFDWNNMIDDYSNSDNYNDNQAEAVATLMQYCGYSIKMDYGPESGAEASDVAKALVNYFNYNKTTTKWVLRSLYSYANWTDLIYHELANGRPIVYCGQSNGGGHAFVCDGYKLEKNTDLFHINWGWSGTSDGYFVLSALNPDQQGTGGSSSTDGYHFGQEVIIGIQKTGSTGSTLDVQTNKYNLTINSISLSHSTIALGESVNVTINVTNSGSEAYDGDLMLVKEKDGYIFWGKSFIIPADNNSHDYVINYTPTDATPDNDPEKLHAVFVNNEGNYARPDPDDPVSLTIVDQTPSELTATNISISTATIGWTNVGNANKWNLRSRTTTLTTEDFSGTDLQWSPHDGDGDRHTWEINSNAGIGGSPCYASQSYDNTFDWLRTPLFTLGGTFSFYAWGEGESFRVYVSTNNYNYYPISELITATNNQTLYTFDLSSYAETEGRIAIIHQNSSSQTPVSYLYVDDATFIEPDGQWTTYNNVTNTTYSLTGLTRGTNYLVQVQAVINNGGKWSTPATFKTSGFALGNSANNTEVIQSENGHTVDICLSNRTLYKDGKWNTLCLPFGVNLSATNCPLAGEGLKVMAFDTDNSSFANGTLTLNFTTVYDGSTYKKNLVAGTPYLIKWTKAESYDEASEDTRDIKNPVFTGVTIDKTMHNQTCDLGNGNSITFCGTYTPISFTSDDNTKLFIGAANTLYYPKSSAKINSCRAYFQLNGITAGDMNSQVRTFNLNFGDEGDKTGITTTNFTNFTNSSDAWYDLSGRRLSGKPSAKGLYINNGRLEIIK